MLKRVGRFNRVLGGDHKLERADPMVQCEVQAHKSTALEFNQHLVGAIFHMIGYACAFGREWRFSADIACAKSISRLTRRERARIERSTPDFHAKGTPANPRQGATAPSTSKNSIVWIGGYKKGRVQR